MTDSRTPKDCKYYDFCSANLCPLDPHVKSKIWCPEENEHNDICRNSEFRNLQFVKIQKKIARAVKKNQQDRDDFFDFRMLNRNIVIKRAIRGIPDPRENARNPDEWYRSKEERWISVHHEKRPLSSEETERRRNRMKMIRKVPSSIHFPEIRTIGDTIRPDGEATQNSNGGRK